MSPTAEDRRTADAEVAFDLFSAYGIGKSTVFIHPAWTVEDFCVALVDIGKDFWSSVRVAISAALAWKLSSLNAAEPKRTGFHSVSAKIHISVLTAKRVPLRI